MSGPSKEPSKVPAVRVYGTKPKNEPQATSPLLVGLITGILLSFLWLGLVYVTHTGVGLAAWGVGALIGVTVAKAARPPTPATGAIALFLTLGTVILAKALVIAIALKPIALDELLSNRDATTMIFMADMVKNHSFSPELQSTLDSLEQAPHDTGLDEQRLALSERMIDDARARMKAASHAERERVVRASTEWMLTKLDFWSLMGKAFGWWDLWWLAFGLSTAWKIGQGIG